jgi:dynein heavy chain
MPLSLGQVVDLQASLKEEHIIVEEKKAATQALIENIGKEKAVVDEAVEAGRVDEEAAAKLQVSHLVFDSPDMIILHLGFRV